MTTDGRAMTQPLIADSVLDLVGATPLVRLQRISPPGGAEILGGGE